MSMRDLIPWARQGQVAPAPYRDEQHSPFFSLRRDIDRLFDDMFRGSAPSFDFGRTMSAWPSVEVVDTDREVRITAELPGMAEKDIDLIVEDGVLTLRGEKKSEIDDKDRGYSERFYGRFERRIALPSGADENDARAEFRDGVLNVILPKTEQAERGRRIPISSETRH